MTGRVYNTCLLSRHSEPVEESNLYCYPIIFRYFDSAIAPLNMTVE
ncbi:MAG: hypothetical protein K2O08_01175 [Clostridia bacterium]|nr:hypothetical protein [Clostridia bacterium]